jgi:hypothetical protein
MWALKYTITFVKTCNLKMLYLFFGNEVRLDISIFNFQLHYLHTFMMQLFFILMMSTEASWFCIMIGVLELFLCLNMKITTFKLENTTIVVSLIVLSSNIHNYFFEEYFFGLVDYLLFFFFLGCVYLCSHLPCTFDGWVPILDFYLQDFSSISTSPWFIRLSPIPSNSILFTFWFHWATRYEEGIWSN